MSQHPSEEATILGQSTSGSPSGRTSFILKLTLLVVLPLSILLPYLVWRMSFQIKVAQIASLGGETSVGPPPVYQEYAYSSKHSETVRNLATSPVGRWAFEQDPTVWSIDLRGVKNVDDLTEAIEIASEFENIREIVLYQSAANDAHLKLISERFPKLERLKANETQITDLGISYLKAMPRLRQVNAQRTSITDASVEDFAAIPRLSELNIAETKITDQTPILDAHPMCRITTDLVTKKMTTDRQRIAARRKAKATPTTP